MLNVTVKSNSDRIAVAMENTDTPIAAFEKANINPASSVCNLNGMILSAADLNTTFEALGITDGSSCSLSAIVKADGANL